ncbi:MAG: hypothetical protein PHE03_13085 [Bacteroidales bacterium]|nr:hypothetical protein [Bacteroidales bacterium]
MKNLSSYILLILFFCLSSIGTTWSQTVKGNAVIGDYFRIAQKKDTEELLKEKLRELPLGTKSVYAVLFRPQMCPRCEVDINQLPYIKMLDSTATILLWVSYPNGQAARRYIEKKGFISDAVIIDTTESYRNIFSLSAGRLSVTYTLKISKERGLLLFGGDVPEWNDETLISFYNAEEPLKFNDFGTDPLISTADESRPPKSNNLLNRQTIPLISNTSQPISEVYETPSLYNNILCFNDELAETFYAFSISEEKGTLLEAFKTSLDEEISFTDTLVVNRSRFMEMKQNNQVFIMPNKCSSIGNGKYLLSFSLPNMFRSPSGGIAYFNKPAFFKWDVNSNARELYSLTFIKDKFNYSPIFLNDHTEFSPNGDSEVMIPVRKGYPLFELEIEEWKGDPKDFNPLLPEFYEDTPLFHCYDLTSGKLLSSFGQLDTIYQHYRVGYAFTFNQLYHRSGNYAAYSCETSGLVHIVAHESPETVIRSVKVFDIPLNIELMGTPGTRNYLNIAERKVFSQTITDLKLTQEALYVLYQERDNTWFNCYSLTGHQLHKILLPKTLGMPADLVTYALFEQNGQVGPFAIHRDGNEHAISLFSLPLN